MIVRRAAFSVVTGIGFSRLLRITETMIHRSKNPMLPKIM